MDEGEEDSEVDEGRPEVVEVPVANSDNDEGFEDESEESSSSSQEEEKRVPDKMVRTVIL